MKKRCALKLYEIGALQFGEFTLKSGKQSPFYIDLRLIISYPELLQTISDLLWEKIKHLSFSRLCGVPYTALPIATAMSLKHELPMVLKRKEKKDYGTKKILEGVYQKGDTCLIVEDIVTSGLSVFETIEPMEELGLVIKDIAVVIDREQGGRKAIESKGYTLHSLFSLTEIVSYLVEENKIDAKMSFSIQQYLQLTP